MGEMTAGRGEDEAAAADADGEVDPLIVMKETVAHLDSKRTRPPGQRGGGSTGGPMRRQAHRPGQG